ncbi:MAG: FkbM family methyltransferase [Terracidiphilus sp.]
MALKLLFPERLLMRLRVSKELKRGEPELKLVQCICNRSELSIDVGANRGVYAYLFSRHSERVLAVEPHPLMVEHLKKSLPGSVWVLNFAASDEEGECEFHIPQQAGRDVDSRCSLEAGANGEFTTRTITVERKRLDKLSMGGRSVGVIKIDVEGHELSTLRGITGLIVQSKPTIIVESEARHHSGAPQNVFQFLLQFGYRGYFVHRGNLRVLDEFSADRFQASNAEKAVDGKRSPDYVNNFLFIHPSRAGVLDRVKRIFPLISPHSNLERSIQPGLGHSRESELGQKIALPDNSLFSRARQ